MRIKQLELSGFKSFKDRTVIHFSEGITGIVGPNGCGKSNIVDALVWVMGEMSAKHLRGSSMSDVIFAGAEGYAPMGMAEVSLTLENDGGPFPAQYLKHSEIMITRRLHRSGETEYLINKEQMRLRDIQEIFMDTGAGSKGFSIIEQGRISEIISKKPLDRRTLIEEVAGITKFKVRKKESQRKLASTEQNLLRLQDIIGEQKRQINGLERQAQRAERYRKIKNELEQKDLWLSITQFENLRNDIERIQKEHDEIKETGAASDSQISSVDSKVQSLKLTLGEQQNLLDTLLAEHQDCQNNHLAQEGKIKDLEFEIEQARRDKETAHNYEGEHHIRKNTLTEEKDRLTDQIAEAKKWAEEAQAQLNTDTVTYAEVTTQLNEAEQSLRSKRQSSLSATEEKSRLETLKTSSENQLTERMQEFSSEQTQERILADQQTKLSQTHKTVSAALEEKKQLQLDLMKDAETFQANFTQLEAQVETQQKNWENAKENYNQTKHRLESLSELQANYEGLETGTKNVLTWSEGGQFKLIADLVEVHPDYEVATTSALRSQLQTFVGDKTFKAAINAINYLKTNHLGRSSFATTTLNEGPQQNPSQEPGVIGCLNQWVSAPSEYEAVIAGLTQNIWVVESVKTALDLQERYSQCCWVTPEGDSLFKGVLTGGSALVANSNILSRKREIKELTTQVNEQASQLTVLEVQYKKTQSQRDTIQKDLEISKEKCSGEEVQLTALKKDFERIDEQIAELNTRLTHQKQKVEKTKEAVAQLKTQIEDSQNGLVELSQSQGSSKTEVEQIETRIQELRNKATSLQNSVTKSKVEWASKNQKSQGLESQLKLVSSSLATIEEQISKTSNKASQSSEAMTKNQVLLTEAKTELETYTHRVETAAQQLSQARNDFEKTQTEIRESEEALSQFYRNRGERQSQINAAQLELDQLRLKEQNIIDQVNEKYMKEVSVVAQQFIQNPPAFITASETEVTATVVQKEVEELRDKLHKLGEVNLSSISEYDELIERHDFLNEQCDELTNAKQQLTKVIDRINRICSKRFKETFEQVNERFTKVFPALFGGGEAQLTLVEYPEKQEWGIDIVARPPGKKLQNISLLSGGEKALTAVSLIFSIFLVKPSPFCLLDEVDAPLDDANVFRFNELVTEMAKKSQMIVVTHNKHTMKVNNKLFGVTMEEKGVSKMVSVDLDQSPTALPPQASL